MPSSETRPTVAALIADGVTTFEFAVPCEVFGIDRSEDVGAPWYRYLVCAADPPPLRTSTGFTIDGVAGLDELAEADTVVVPGWRDVNDEPPAAMTAALRAAADRGARIVSLCTGAFVVAAAGLLDGRPATTHWKWAADLKARYPRVRLDPAVLYVDDGDVLTSAGTAASIDLCLHLVRTDYGADAANAVARRMVVPPHRDGGQAQYVDHPVPSSGGVDGVARAMAFAQQDLTRELDVETLAAQAAMSARHFAREFRRATGTTPHRWITQQRVLLARRLLERTDLPVDVVAHRAGFGSPVTLRHHFRSQMRCSPDAYRRTFATRPA